MASCITTSAFRPVTVPCARLRVEAGMCAASGGFAVIAAGRSVPRSQEASVYPRRR